MERKGKKAMLIIANSVTNSDLYFATKFLASDDFVYVQTEEEKILITYSLEADRAVKEAGVDRVINIGDIIKNGGLESLTMIEVIGLILKDLGITTIVVPESFSYKHGKEIEQEGFFLEVKKDPLFDARAIKTQEEIEKIAEVQKESEDVLCETIEIIRKSNVKNGVLHYMGKVLTSEAVRAFIKLELYKKGYYCEDDVLVSCGDEVLTPHLKSTSPLRVNLPIVIDIYPRSLKTRYWGDMTRTVVKGKASPEFKKQYQTVLEVQELAISRVKEGVDVVDLYELVRDFFESKGYKTGKINGKMQGFFHSLGHGVGLDIHEIPNVDTVKYPLKAGNIITIEPGLYYEGVGGVRIEDIVVVTKDGCINLNKLPKHLMEL